MTLLCRYFDDGTGAPALEAMQKEHWDPLLIWMSETFNVEVSLATGFLPAEQEPNVIERLRKEIENLDPWELAGM